MNRIGFPGLDLEFFINPVAFTVFGWDIHWYGIIIASGLIIAVIVANYLAKKEGLGKDVVTDVVVFSIPVAVICARAYYVIFNFSQYRDNLSDIYKIWNGGLAIYGAIIGAVVTAYIYCRVTKTDFKKLSDVGAIGLLIGQTIGRWGNFVNGEAYGSATTLPWRMDIYGEAMGVHPTFLYESLWNLATLCVLLAIFKKKKFDGQIFLSYITIYGIGRFMIEGLRSDSLMVGPVRISQAVALACAVVGVCLLVRGYIQEKRQNAI